jgi:hypothetical protein
MKKIIITFTVIVCTVTLLFVSCSTPIGLTSWKNPQSTAQIGKVVVLAMFDKLTYVQPFEEQLVSYFNSQNLKSIEALDFMEPFKQYTNDALNAKLDSVGADGLLLISYKGTDVSINTTGGFYGGYRGWYGGGGQVWTTSTVNLRAKLYEVKNDVLLWSGDLTVTDPSDITSTSQQVAKAIFADFLKNNLLKNPPPPAQK